MPPRQRELAQQILLRKDVLSCSTLFSSRPTSLIINAWHLQFAIVLFHILPLKPLVDAKLAEPPILVFPSFEGTLEEKDAVTQAGLASLSLRVIGPVCNATLSTIDELFEYVGTHNDAFLDAVTRERLFVAPGENPNNLRSAAESAEIYLQELKGVRESGYLERLEGIPRGILREVKVGTKNPGHHHALSTSPMCTYLCTD